MSTSANVIVQRTESGPPWQGQINPTINLLLVSVYQRHSALSSQMSPLPVCCWSTPGDWTKDFFMSGFDEIKSPFLRKVLQRRGINDDQVTSLLILYQAAPGPR